VLLNATKTTELSYRFLEAIVSLSIPIVHQQLKAVTPSSYQPLCFLDIGRVKLIKLSGFHVLKHYAVVLQFQLSRILDPFKNSQQIIVMQHSFPPQSNKNSMSNTATAYATFNVNSQYFNNMQPC